MNKVINFFKTVWLVFWWLLFSILLSFPIGVAGLLERRGIVAFKLCQLWVWVAKSVCFTRFEYVKSDKIDPNASYIVVSNHQSGLDIPGLMLMNMPLRWVLKKELGYLPFFGWALLASRQIFVDRSKPKQALKTLAQKVAALPPGVNVAIFPEGTRSTTGELLDFKVGGFLTAITTQKPILPVTINGSYKVIPKKGSMAFYPGTIQLTVADPIDTTGYTRKDLSRLVKETKEIIAGNLNPNYPD